jgi:hypothetical protein
MRTIAEDATVGLRVGAVAVLTVDLDVASVAHDPDELEVVITDPEDEETTYVLGVDAELAQALDDDDVAIAGRYVASIPATIAGRWTYAWTSVGSAGADAGDYDVEA